MIALIAIISMYIALVMMIYERPYYASALDIYENIDPPLQFN